MYAKCRFIRTVLTVIFCFFPDMVTNPTHSASKLWLVTSSCGWYRLCKVPARKSYQVWVTKILIHMTLEYQVSTNIQLEENSISASRLHIQNPGIQHGNLECNFAIPLQRLPCGIVRLKKLVNFIHSSHVRFIIYHTDWLLGSGMVPCTDIDFSGLLIVYGHQHMNIIVDLWSVLYN